MISMIRVFLLPPGTREGKEEAIVVVAMEEVGDLLRYFHKELMSLRDTIKLGKTSNCFGNSH
jgi:ribosome-interacting GTPase 1